MGRPHPLSSLRLPFSPPLIPVLVSILAGLLLVIVSPSPVSTITIRVCPGTCPPEAHREAAFHAPAALDDGEVRAAAAKFCSSLRIADDEGEQCSHGVASAAIERLASLRVDNASSAGQGNREVVGRRLPCREYEDAYLRYDNSKAYLPPVAAERMLEQAVVILQQCLAELNAAEEAYEPGPARNITERHHQAETQSFFWQPFVHYYELLITGTQSQFGSSRLFEEQYAYMAAEEALERARRALTRRGLPATHEGMYRVAARLSEVLVMQGKALAAWAAIGPLLRHDDDLMAASGAASSGKGTRKVTAGRGSCLPSYDLVIPWGRAYLGVAGRRQQRHQRQQGRDDHLANDTGSGAVLLPSLDQVAALLRRQLQIGNESLTTVTSGQSTSGLAHFECARSWAPPRPDAEEATLLLAQVLSKQSNHGAALDQFKLTAAMRTARHGTKTVVASKSTTKNNGGGAAAGSAESWKEEARGAGAQTMRRSTAALVDWLRNTVDAFSSDRMNTMWERRLAWCNQRAREATVASSSTSSVVFIVGMSRSGTSLMEQILSTDERVRAEGEVPNMFNEGWIEDLWVAGFPQGRDGARGKDPFGDGRSSASSTRPAPSDAMHRNHANHTECGNSSKTWARAWTTSNTESSTQLLLLPRVFRDLLSSDDTVVQRANVRLDELARRFWGLLCPALDDCRGPSNSTTHITNKMPEHAWILGAIRLMLPHAKIINMVRDPADVGLSNFMTWFPPLNMPFAWDLDNAATLVAAHWQIMEHWRRILPPYPIDAEGATGAVEFRGGNYYQTVVRPENSTFVHDDARRRRGMFDVIYEDLVTTPRAILPPLLAYLDLDLGSVGGNGGGGGVDKAESLEAFLRFHDSSRVVATPSATQVKRPLYKSSMGKWRKYGMAAVRPLLNTLQCLLTMFRIDRNGKRVLVPPPPPLRLPRGDLWQKENKTLQCDARDPGEVVTAWVRDAEAHVRVFYDAMARRGRPYLAEFCVLHDIADEHDCKSRPAELLPMQLVGSLWRWAAGVEVARWFPSCRADPERSQTRLQKMDQLWACTYLQLLVPGAPRVVSSFDKSRMFRSLGALEEASTASARAVMETPSRLGAWALHAINLADLYRSDEALNASWGLWKAALPALGTCGGQHTEAGPATGDSPGTGRPTRFGEDWVFDTRGFESRPPYRVVREFEALRSAGTSVLLSVVAAAVDHPILEPRHKVDHLEDGGGASALRFRDKTALLVEYRGAVYMEGPQALLYHEATGDARRHAEDHPCVVYGSTLGLFGLSLRQLMYAYQDGSILLHGRHSTETIQATGEIVALVRPVISGNLYHWLIETAPKLLLLRHAMPLDCDLAENRKRASQQPWWSASNEGLDAREQGDHGNHQSRADEEGSLVQLMVPDTQLARETTALLGFGQVGPGGAKRPVRFYKELKPGTRMQFARVFEVDWYLPSSPAAGSATARTVLEGDAAGHRPAWAGFEADKFGMGSLHFPPHRALKLLNVAIGKSLSAAAGRQQADAAQARRRLSDHEQPTTVIWVSRRDASWRHIENEDELLAALAAAAADSGGRGGTSSRKQSQPTPLGVDTVKAPWVSNGQHASWRLHVFTNGSRLSLRAQLQLFRTADVFAGVMGAGMSNMVATRPCAQLVHLAHQTHWPKLPFWVHLAASLGLGTWNAPSFGSNLRGPADCNFALNRSTIDEVVRTVSAAVEAARVCRHQLAASVGWAG